MARVLLATSVLVDLWNSHIARMLCLTCCTYPMPALAKKAMAKALEHDPFSAAKKVMAKEVAHDHAVAKGRAAVGTVWGKGPAKK